MPPKSDLQVLQESLQGIQEELRVLSAKVELLITGTKPAARVVDPSCLAKTILKLVGEGGLTSQQLADKLVGYESSLVQKTLLQLLEANQLAIGPDLKVRRLERLTDIDPRWKEVD